MSLNISNTLDGAYPELEKGLAGLQDRFSNAYITLALSTFALGSFGVLGNILSAIVLSAKPMRCCSINVVLLCLAFWDIISIVGISAAVGSYYCVLYLITGHEDIFDYWTALLSPTVYATALMGQHGSNGFTLLATLERYIFVCKPLRAREIITMRRTYSGAIGMTVLIVLYNLPFCFEYTAITGYLEEGGRYVQLTRTEFADTAFFTWFYSKYPELVISHVIPMILLIIGNVRIWYELRKCNKRRKSMTSCAASGIESKDISMTKITMTIIGLSVVSNLLQVIWLILGGDSFYQNTLSGFANMLMMFVMVANSSVNFLIYCGLGKNFRTHFKKRFDFSSSFRSSLKV